MNLPFNPKTFLTCPQGPELVGEARDRACHLLDIAITQGRVLLAARLLTRDPSLIYEDLGGQESVREPAVRKAITAEMNILVLFALAHGMSVTNRGFGAPHGLLQEAVFRNSPGLVSCALIYTTERDLTIWDVGESALSHAEHAANKVERDKATQILLMLLDAGGVPPAAINAGVFLVLGRLRHSICEQYSDQAKRESVDGFSINQAPEGFLGAPQGPRTAGAERDSLRKLLEMAMTQGRLVTSTKILAKDPSLITETLGDAGHKQTPAMTMAVCAGMESLVAFGLAQEMDPCAPIHLDDNDSALLALQAPRGLLDAAKHMESPSLASYALPYRADPNQSDGYDNDGRLVSDLPPLLDNALWDVAELASLNSLQLAKMLLSARVNLDDSSKAVKAVHDLCMKSGWACPEVNYRQVLSAIMRRGGLAYLNMRVSGSRLICYAAMCKNIGAVKLLIEAGANIDPEFLGADLFTVLKTNGQHEHIPGLSELIIRQQSVRSAQRVLNPSVTIVAPTDEPGTSKLRTRKLTAIDVF